MESLEEYPQVDSESKEKGGRNARNLRIFDHKMRNLCWQKAEVVPGRHPERWRKDPAGNVVCRRLTRCEGCLCYEYDHIQPYSKGGETDVSNCQILQSRVNRLKSDKDDLGKQALQQFSCDIKFGDKEMDLVEMAVYGNVERVGWRVLCSKGTVDVERSTQDDKDGYLVQYFPLEGKSKKFFGAFSGVQDEIKSFAQDVSSVVFGSKTSSEADPRSSVSEAVSDVAVIEAFLKSSDAKGSTLSVEVL